MFTERSIISLSYTYYIPSICRSIVILKRNLHLQTHYTPCSTTRPQLFCQTTLSHCYLYLFSIHVVTPSDSGLIQSRKYIKMNKKSKDKLVMSPRENGGG